VRQRIASIDLLRGIVMVLMALDHTRDFFSNAAFDPLNLARTNEALFLTRWITHFCAPVFVFLAGTGAYLSLARGRSKRDLSWFLVTRGLWLIVLELTLLRCFGYQFNVDYRVTMLVVLWALGWAMIVLGLLARLPIGAVIAFGAIGFGIWIVIEHFIRGHDVPGWATLVTGMMLFSGVQLLSIGVLGEYLARVFEEVKRRPMYVVADDADLTGWPASPLPAPGAPPR
jgi:uncharacterized membrane protein